MSFYDTQIQHQENDSWLGTTRHYCKALNRDITNNDNNSHYKINNKTQLLLTIAMNRVNGCVIVITTATACLYFEQFFSDFWK